MPEQSKFENMDLFASLEAIMKQNTGFYQSDLDIDKEIIAKAAASPHREDKTLLWFCRPSGTHCFRERDVFLKDTAPHNTWRFYMEQTSDRVLAYAIELTGKVFLRAFSEVLQGFRIIKSTKSETQISGKLLAENRNASHAFCRREHTEIAVA